MRVGLVEPRVESSQVRSSRIYRIHRIGSGRTFADIIKYKLVLNLVDWLSLRWKYFFITTRSGPIFWGSGREKTRPARNSVTQLITSVVICLLMKNVFCSKRPIQVCALILCGLHLGLLVDPSVYPLYIGAQPTTSDLVLTSDHFVGRIDEVCFL